MTDAAQGVYLSRGKTAQELSEARAAKEAKENQPYCRINLTQKEEHEFEVAASNVEYLLGNAQVIFEELNVLIAGGMMDSHGRALVSLTDMLGRGFKQAMEDDGEKMARLSVLIRSEKELINDD